MALDILDRKILYHLDINSRQSSKEIAKKIASNRDTVNYRIHRMEEQGPISGYTTHLDTAKFGFVNIKTYIRFQDTNQEKEQEFFSYLKSLPEVGWVVHATGRWDALFCTWATSTFSFYNTFKKILDKFSRNILEKEVIHNVNWFYYNRKWLLPESNEIFPIMYGGEPKQERFDEQDLSILSALVPSARSSFSSVSKKTGIPAQNVNHRVKSLRKKGIIAKFGVDLDYGKMNLVFCKSLIALHNINDKSLDAIYNFCQNEPRIFALATTVGAWDMELEMEVERVEEMMEIMNRIKRKFPDLIRGYDSIVITKQSGINYIPPVSE